MIYIGAVFKPVESMSGHKLVINTLLLGLSVGTNEAGLTLRIRMRMKMLAAIGVGNFLDKC